jgi:hypothetical protein
VATWCGPVGRENLTEQTAKVIRKFGRISGLNANSLNNAAPSLQPHYRAFVTTTGCSVPALRLGTLALAVGAACGLSLNIGEQVLTFHTKAWSSFAPPPCRMPPGQSQDIPQADPGGMTTPGFGIA